MGVPERSCWEMSAVPCAFPGAEWAEGVGRESKGMEKNLKDFF